MAYSAQQNQNGTYTVQFNGQNVATGTSDILGTYGLSPTQLSAAPATTPTTPEQTFNGYNSQGQLVPSTTTSGYGMTTAQQPPTPTPQAPAPTVAQAPAPAQNTQPSTPNATPTGAPTYMPPAGQQAPQQPALTMPATGSIVDLLNSVGANSSFAARQQLAQQFGIGGYTGSATQNQQLAQKYIEAFNANKGKDVPGTAAQASSALDQYFQNNNQATQQDPEKAFIEQYSAMNPAIKMLYDQINSALSPSATQQTFEQEYQNLLTQQGIPALQTQLMNINNIMNGTEDDIRTEVEKAGGIATDSQVQAMTAARNKTLLKQANVLQQQLSLKEDYVNNLMNFSEMDRKAASDKVDQQIGLTSKLADLQDKMVSAAQDNFNNIIKSGGYTALAKAFGDDARGKANAEKVLGLPQGALSNSAFLSSADAANTKMQFVSGTDTQASGYFNPATGKFTPYGGGGGGGGGGGVSNNPQLAGVVDTILGSGSFTKNQANAIRNAINNGEDPATVIKNQAKNIMGQTEATRITQYEASQQSMQALKNDMNKYYAAGGDTSLINGTIEDMAAKIGQVKDPKLRTLATQIEAQLQIYRNAVSGTAYSVQEGQNIASIFPGINKSKELNDAIFAGRDKAFEASIDGAYKAVLGSAYDKLPVGVISKDGKAGTVPQGQLQEALNEGYTRIW